MRRPEWSWLAMAAGACAGVALLAARGEATAVWIAIPLTAWLFAAARGPASVVAAGTQIALIAGLALAASGHLGPGPLSFWDAALAFDVMALVGCVAAWYATGRTHMSGRHPQPTTRRQRLARVGRIAAATVVIAAGCLAGVVAVPANPPTPPPGILFPLPDGLRPTRVSYSCGPIGAQCLWSTVVEADDEASDRLVYELETHLTRTKGWHLATSRCRTWGWVIKERACVTIARPPILIMVSGPPPRPGCTRTDAWPS